LVACMRASAISRSSRPAASGDGPRTGPEKTIEPVVRFSGTSPVAVTEAVAPQQIPHRVEGVTVRPGQIVRATCSVTLVYDVREATGAAVLAQRYDVKLRTRPLRRGAAYALDCMGPLLVQLPAAASAIAATSTDGSGLETVLPVRAPVASVPLAFGRRLRPEPRTQLAVVSWPRALPPGTYRLELGFTLPQALPFREKAIYTASVSCGRSRYLQPILPPVAKMANAPVFTIHPAADPVKLSLPRVAGAIGSYAATRRTLACVR
jgi:hypothetical protein